MIKKLRNNIYSNFLTLIKLAYLYRYNYIIIVYFKKLDPLLSLLIKYNFISFYKFIDKKSVIIWLSARNNKILGWDNLKNYYRPSNFFFLDYYNLNRFYSKEFKKIIILSTSKGIITHHSALKYKIGGTVIFIIY